MMQELDKNTSKESNKWANNEKLCVLWQPWCLLRWSTLYCFFFDECKMELWIIKLTCKIGNHSTWWMDHLNKWGNQGWSYLTQCLCQNLLHSQLCSHTCVPTPQNCGEVKLSEKGQYIPTHMLQIATYFQWGQDDLRQPKTAHIH